MHDLQLQADVRANNNAISACLLAIGKCDQKSRTLTLYIYIRTYNYICINIYIYISIHIHVHPHTEAFFMGQDLFHQPPRSWQSQATRTQLKSHELQSSSFLL